MTLGCLPHQVDDLDPAHLLSLIRYLEDEMTGTTHKNQRAAGEPGVARDLQPGDPHYRPPTEKERQRRAKFEAAAEPTEADIAWVRAGKPMKTKDLRQAARWMRAREILAAKSA